MTKDQLLFQIANVGYSTSYGRDKAYATVDISTKTSGRLTFIGTALGIAGLLYPIINTIGIIIFLGIMFGLISFYIKSYVDKKDSYLASASKLQTIERQLQNLFYTVKASTGDLSSYINQLNDFDTQQKSATIQEQILGSDWYAHVKMFWTKKINSQWFVDELGLKLFFDKLPFSFFVSCLLVMVLILLAIIGFFLAQYLISVDFAKSYIELFLNISNCKK